MLDCKRIAKYLEIRRTLLFIFLLVVSSGMAEMSSNWKDRMGTINPAKAEQLFIEFFNNNSEAGEVGDFFKYHNEGVRYTSKSYETVSRLLSLAPYAEYTFYSTAFLDPVNPQEEGFYQQLMKDEPDPAVRMLYCQDLIRMGCLLYEDNKNLNELRQTVSNLAGTTMSVPLAKVWAAHLYFKYGKQYLPHISVIRQNKAKALKDNLCYSEQKAYDQYREAFREYREAQTEESADMQAAFLIEYFLASQDLYRTDPDSLYPQFLKDYIDVVAACDKCLGPLYQKAESVQDDKAKGEILGQGGYYQAKFFEIKPAFDDSKAGSADRLKSYFGPRLSEMSHDATRLETVISLFAENNSDNNPTVENDVFYAYCKASYAIKPTFLNCFGSALSAQSERKIDDMVDYFKKARDLAVTDGQRAQMSLLVASSLMNMAGTWPTNDNDLDSKGNPKRYGEESEQYRQWFDQYTIVIGNLKQVLDLTPYLTKSSVLNDRSLPAKACHMLGVCYYRLMGTSHMDMCNLAIEWFEKAEQMSTADTRFDETTMIVNCEKVKTQLERNARAREEYARKNAEYARQQAEYQEYLRRKKAEEDFWKGGH